MKCRKPRHRCVLGEAIRLRRKALGLSQEKFAELVEVHRNYVGIIERGEQNVSIDTLVKFAKGLRVPLRDLVADVQT